MKVKTFLSILFLVGFGASYAHAEWIWTPLTRRWINPKHAAKDNPSAQMDWANNSFEKGNYERAVKEYLKLVQTYPRSELAPEAQYLAGVSYEMLDRLDKAFSVYKKVIEVYPFSGRFKDAIEREYGIAESFVSGKRLKVVGPVSMPSIDKAIEIFQHVVQHAPYGPYAAKAQFQLGEAYFKQRRIEEASRAFQKVIDDYPDSPLIEDAQFRVASCAYQLSLKPSYDQSATEEAITWFETFIETRPDSSWVPEAQQSLKRLKEIKAEGLMKIAQFYEKEGKLSSAALYYQEVVQSYPNSPFAAQALSKVKEFEQSGVLKQ